jgi:hypothetical protein
MCVSRGAAHIEIRNVDMPMLVRLQRLLETPLRSRRALSASGRTPSVASPVPHTNPTPEPCPKDAASRWLLCLPWCSATFPSSYIRSVMLTTERLSPLPAETGEPGGSLTGIQSLMLLSGVPISRIYQGSINRRFISPSSPLNLQSIDSATIGQCVSLGLLNSPFTFSQP